jgi:UDP-glucose 4-epimerase
MKYFITGGAGFIGSNLTDRLLKDGHSVVVYDNLSTGFIEFLAEAQKDNKFRFAQADLLNTDLLADEMKSCDFVFHLAANADVRFGINHPGKDLEQNTIATYNVLEAMRQNNIKHIAFASSGSIYGEPDIFPTPEQAPIPVQTSLYGASKLACEGMIQAYCEGFGFKSWIFRFVSILGERYTHGHVFDFYKKLLDNPDELLILGNGKQKKSYLYIQDCIEAMLTATKKADAKVNIFNLGTNEFCEVKNSADWISSHLGFKPIFTYSGGERGWIGDSPFIFLETNKIKSFGWSPMLTIKESIIRTLVYLQNNQWILEKRK